MEEKESQYKKMTATPIPRLIPTLAVPTIISMLITAVYNTADTYFVSQLGTSASGAVGIVFSLMAIIQAFGFTIGMGAGSQISRLLGKKENDKASTIASTAVISSVCLGTFIAIIGISFPQEIMKMLGATDTILPFAMDYARYIFLATPVMMTSFVLNNILRSEGKAQLAMLGILSGGILNIILDPIFIMKLELGIAGAAIATSLSQCVSLAILSYSFVAKKTAIQITVGKISKEWSVYWEIVKYGLPSLCRQGLASVASVLLNLNAAVYGDSAVAAMAIVGKIFMMLFSMLIGFGQGFQPVVGYNYGAGLTKRVREAFWFTLKVGTIVMSVFAIFAFFWAERLIGIFLAEDEAVLRIGVMALRMQSLTMPLLSLCVVCNMAYQSIGRTKEATFLSGARQGVFFIPLILILPGFLGITGVQITQALADICTFVCSIPFAVKFLKTLEEQPKIHGFKEKEEVL